MQRSPRSSRAPEANDKILVLQNRSEVPVIVNDMAYIASATKKPLDVHLMVEHPNNNIEIFLRKLRRGDTVYIHPEAEYVDRKSVV